MKVNRYQKTQQVSYYSPNNKLCHFNDLFKKDKPSFNYQQNKEQSDLRPSFSRTQTGDSYEKPIEFMFSNIRQTDFPNGQNYRPSQNTEYQGFKSTSSSNFSQTLFEQNNNLKQHKYFLVNEIQRYKEKIKKYKEKNKILSCRVKQLERQKDVIQLQYQHLKDIILSKQPSQEILPQSQLVKDPTFRQLIPKSQEESHQVGYLIEKTANFLQKSPHNNKEINIHEPKIETLSDQFDALMYEYKTTKDVSLRKQCIDIAKQIKQLKADSQPFKLFKGMNLTKEDQTKEDQTISNDTNINKENMKAKAKTHQKIPSVVNSSTQDHNHQNISEYAQRNNHTYYSTKKHKSNQYWPV